MGSKLKKLRNQAMLQDNRSPLNFAAGQTSAGVVAVALWDERNEDDTYIVFLEMPRPMPLREAIETAIGQFGEDFSRTGHTLQESQVITLPLPDGATYDDFKALVTSTSGASESQSKGGQA